MPQEPIDYTMRYQIRSGRVNFANYVQRRQLIQDGDLLGLNLLPPDNDASIVPNIQEGAVNTTPAEFAEYLAAVKPTGPTVPAAPTNLVATPGDGEASIAFTAPSDGGSPITNYEYINLDASGAAFEPFLPAVTTSPVTIAGLPNGTTLHIRLRAVNAVGPGAESDIVEVTPVGPPDAPFGLTATPGNGQLSIAFSQGSDGGSPITNYQYSTDDGATFRAFSPVDITSPVVITKLSSDGTTDLTNGTSYTIRLKAVTAIGVSDSSDPITATPNITETIQTFTTVGSTTWTAPAGVTSVEYLIVGGGGGSGGGYDTGGGGGGGGGMVLTGTYSVTPATTYSIVVGDGGAGGISIRSPVSETNGSSGQNSEFDSIIALGGGGGYASRLPVGGNNSSGGPGATNPSVASEGGRGGGSAGDGNGAGGGGGGSSGNGDNGVANVGGNGGNGTTNTLTGTSVTYGVGGRGSNGNATYIAIAGTSNTGNGARGGGGASGQDENGAKGGSGIIVLKYYL
jgi:hypothetical protein